MREVLARVIRSWAPTPTTHALRLERPAGFVFQAGQYVLFRLETETGEDDRFLSIASSPRRDHLEFAVRLSDSPFKRAFRQLKPHDRVVLQGPSGKFLLDELAGAVFLSGGIGITPIKSMIEYATDRSLPIPILLL